MSEEKVDVERIKKEIIEVLETIYDPEIPVDIWNLGLIYRLDVSPEGEVEIDMTLTAPGCPMIEVLQQEVATKVAQVDGVKSVKVNIVWTPRWTIERATEEGKSALAALGIPIDPSFYY